MNAIDVLREVVRQSVRRCCSGEKTCGICVKETEAIDRLARLVEAVADVYGESCDTPCQQGCPTCSIRTCLAAVLGEEAK